MGSKQDQRRRTKASKNKTRAKGRQAQARVTRQSGARAQHASIRDAVSWP